MPWRRSHPLAVTMTGDPAAATTIARKRAVLYNVLKYAVRERKLLSTNPIDQVDWKAPERVEQVDRSVVANPVQARQLLAAVTYVGRMSGRGGVCVPCTPACTTEAYDLRKRRGSGSTPTVARPTMTRVSSAARSGEKRVVPIPPDLVTILHEHLKQFGTAEDGRAVRHLDRRHRLQLSGLA
ncbi:hypothetical protein [Actinoallomurus acaciae]|uniref:Uncharacterized protein n=1 Tax=Actinoallomurus acaciae TaxID=502577 RepID=A0ABV5YJ98_9ACTN